MAFKYSTGARAAGAPSRGRGWPMTCFDKLVTTLLIYVNLFLAGYAGAGLATTARLMYDPTTSVVAREIFPDDFNLASMALPMASVGLLALAHFAVAALVMPRCLRFFMLMLYAAAMLGAVCAEGWLAHEVWIDVHHHIQDGRRRLDEIIWHLQFILDIIAVLHHFAWKLKSILWEVERDAPMNITVAQRAIVVFAALQVSAAVLAVLAALTGLRRRPAVRPPH